jgi:hypothetical protein
MDEETLARLVEEAEKNEGPVARALVAVGLVRFGTGP